VIRSGKPNVSVVLPTYNRADALRTNLGAALADYQRDPDRRAREGRLARKHAELTHSAAHVATEFERIVAAAIAGRAPA